MKDTIAKAKREEGKKMVIYASTYCAGTYTYIVDCFLMDMSSNGGCADGKGIRICRVRRPHWPEHIYSSRTYCACLPPLAYLFGSLVVTMAHSDPSDRGESSYNPIELGSQLD